MGKRKYYITTPIYYVNAAPHIGHAYTQVVVDSLSRYHRMLGDEVFFLTGTDEHGEKIEEASVKAGFGPGREKDFVDTIVSNFRGAWSKLNIEYDYFIRTTDPEHEKVVQEFLNRMKDAGDIYEGEYDGWYCTPCETFWTDTQAEGEVCPDCGRPVNRLKEKNYFFRMKKHEKWLVDYINSHQDFIMPEFRRNEVLGFLREGLNDLCISRPRARMSWGIELPFDREYVVYVWFEALINYISGIKATGRDISSIWPAECHMIAKDILRHHAVFWPIMLKSLGLEMPGTIFAHGWWKMGDEKMSKSKGNIVNPLELAEKYGVDPVRYFLVKAVILGNDGAFSEDALVTMYNSDLANDLGNLLNRTLTMVEKYFGGISPEAQRSQADHAQVERSRELLGNVINMLPFIKENYLDTPRMLLKEAVDHIMSVVGKANKYIEESAPWGYAKKADMASISLIMSDLLEVLRTSAIALYPFMPSSSSEMWRQLGLGDLEKELADGALSKELTEYCRTSSEDFENRFPSGIRVNKGNPLFMRLKQ